MKRLLFSRLASRTSIGGTRALVIAGLLLAALAVGGFLRFDNLMERGLVEWDEGVYLIESQFIHSAVKLIDNLGDYRGTGGAARFEADIQGRPPTSAKPGHDLAIYVISLFVGMKDYTSQVTSAVFGMFSILVVYLISARLFSREAAVAAAAAVAASGLHVMFSRSGHAEIVSPLFLLLGVAGLVSLGATGRTRYWLALGTGLALGYAVTCNYRWIPIVIALLVAGLLWTALFAGRDSRRASYRGLGVVALAGLVPPFIMQVPYWAGRAMGLTFESYHGPTYFDHVWWFYETKTGEGKFLPHDLFVSTLWGLDGALILLLAAAGFALVLWRVRNWRYVAFAVPAVIPLLLFSLNVRGDRMVAISVIAPFMAVLVGLAVHELARRLPERMTLPALSAVVAAILAVGVWLNTWQLDVRADWRGVMRYIEDAGSPKLLGYQPAIAKSYLGLANARNVPKDDAEMAEAINDGFRFLVLDWKKYHDDYYNDMVRYIEGNCTPVATFENNVVFFPIFVNDFHYAHPGSTITHSTDVYETHILNDPYADVIRLYDISGFMAGRC